MAGKVPPEVRSRMMAQVKSKGTGPEMAVRRLLHGMGYRYRLHSSSLPGRPDIVFPSKRKVVFVNGCFWHQHVGCRGSHIPLTNREYWQGKLQRNQARDYENIKALEGDGWSVAVVWECQLVDVGELATRLGSFLESETANEMNYATQEETERPPTHSPIAAQGGRDTRGTG